MAEKSVDGPWVSQGAPDDTVEAYIVDRDIVCSKCGYAVEITNREVRLLNIGKEDCGSFDERVLWHLFIP